MYNKSVLDAWIEKYGMEEANKKYQLWKQHVSEGNKHKSLFELWFKKYGYEFAKEHEKQRIEKMLMTKKLHPYRMSEEMKRKYSIANKGENNPMFGKVAYPKLFFVQELGHKVRSYWEQAVCTFLKNHNIKYSYETTTFKVDVNGERHSYTPDIVLDDGIFIEVKGPLFPFQKAKMQQFLCQYPDKSLILIIGNGRWSNLQLISTRHIIYEEFEKSLLGTIEEVKKMKNCRSVA
jgi:hypothetical protein